MELDKTPEKACLNCRFFRPKHYRLGICERQDCHGSMFHTKADLIFVSTDFCCSQFERPIEVNRETC